ncbi:hypothetical protein BOS5A_80100 [Bosea sp. EC-HK365B]|nr:hypothetical protein BOSE21B_111492 [Bosea sp. 21B]CAD5269969.1 hypothetical protein BOSE7B_20147 [Bosea sp. 7B]VVT62440.1 hypothetical protein BOS5A_80100 [Bosea sp. EC-HK365B]VXC64529.1 hypothetical protein BOSE127_30161 [Bosea sp. 127]
MRRQCRRRGIASGRAVRSWLWSEINLGAAALFAVIASAMAEAIGAAGQSASGSGSVSIRARPKPASAI